MAFYAPLNLTFSLILFRCLPCHSTCYNDCSGNKTSRTNFMRFHFIEKTGANKWYRMYLFHQNESLDAIYHHTQTVGFEQWNAIFIPHWKWTPLLLFFIRKSAQISRLLISIDHFRIEMKIPWINFIFSRENIDELTKAMLAIQCAFPFLYWIHNFNWFFVTLFIPVTIIAPIH